MSILRNRYFRCFVAAGAAGLMAGPVSKLLDWTVPELTMTDGLLNDIETGSILGVLAGITAVALAAAFGPPEGGESPIPATPAAGAA